MCTAGLRRCVWAGGMRWQWRWSGRSSTPVASVIGIYQQRVWQVRLLLELAPHRPKHPRRPNNEHQNTRRLVIPRYREMVGDGIDDDYGWHEKPNSPLRRSGVSPSRLG